MQRTNFNSYHIVTDHYRRHHKMYIPIEASLRAEDCLNDIRRHLDRLGIYVAANEWLTFIERFCVWNLEGEISLDRKKFMLHKDVSDKMAAKLLGEELQHHPEMLKKLKAILKGDKARHDKPRKAPVKPTSRPMEHHWAS